MSHVSLVHAEVQQDPIVTSVPSPPPSGVVLREDRSLAAAFAMHDAKNLLAIICANTEYLRMVLHEGPAENETMDESLEDIATASKRLGDLLKEALDSARGEEPKPSQMTMVRVGSFIRAIVDSVRHRAALNQLRFSVAGDDSTTAVLDHALTRRILDNLIDNAIRHSPFGGKVEVTFVLREESLIITVADEGPGVPEMDRERIFDPFFSTARLSLRPGGVSAGLGLTFCRNAAHSHGGGIHVSSRYPHGACFELELKVANYHA